MIIETMSLGEILQTRQSVCLYYYEGSLVLFCGKDETLLFQSLLILVRPGGC